MVESIAYQFAENTTFDWEHKHVTVQKQLGSGLFTDVYQGRVDGQTEVAIKVFKTGMGAEMRRRFSEEMTHLTGVWQQWQTAYPREEPPTPFFYGGQDDANPPFFLMELIRGETFASLLMNGKVLGEAEALGLMRQLGQLLGVLHEGLGKSYADIKFENFWVVSRPNQSALLKVMDWNVLTEVDQAGVTRDLFYASLYLYGLLTGSMPDYAGVALRSRLTDDPGFDRLTYGTRDFLHRSLHPNLTRRYQTAREWTDAIRALENGWVTGEQNLLMAADQALREAQANHSQGEALRETGRKARESGDEALAARFLSEAAAKLSAAADRFDCARRLYDIAGQRKVQGDEQVWAQRMATIATGLQTTSHLSRGRELLQAGFYTGAIELFDTGAELTPVNPEALRRWGWIARAANEMGVTAFEQIKALAFAGVEALIAENYAQAKNNFEMALRCFEKPAAGLAALHREAAVCDLANEAERLLTQQNYDQAIRCLEAAFELAKTLPKDPPTRWAESVGDLNARLQEVMRQKAAHQALAEAYRQIDQYRQAGLWDQMAAQYAEIQRIAPTDLPEGCKGWLAAVEDLLAEGNLSGAQILAEKAVLSPAMKRQARPVWNLIADLVELQAAVQAAAQLSEVTEPQPETAAWLSRFTALAKQFYSAHATEPGEWRSISRLFVRTVKVGLEQALEIQDYGQASDQADVLSRLIRSAEVPEAEKAQALSAYLEYRVERRRVDAEDLYQEALGYHLQNTFAASCRAAEIARHIETLLPADDVFFHTHRSTLDEIYHRLDALQKEVDEQKQRSAEAIAALENQYLSIDSQLTDNKKALDALDQVNARDLRLRQVYIEDNARLLPEGLAVLIRLQALLPDDPGVESRFKRYNEAVSALGLEGWWQVCEQARYYLAPAEAALVQPLFNHPMDAQFFAEAAKIIAYRLRCLELRGPSAGPAQEQAGSTLAGVLIALEQLSKGGESDAGALAQVFIEQVDRLPVGAPPSAWDLQAGWEELAAERNRKPTAQPAHRRAQSRIFRRVGMGAAGLAVMVLLVYAGFRLGEQRSAADHAPAIRAATTEYRALQSTIEALNNRQLPTPAMVNTATANPTGTPTPTATSTPTPTPTKTPTISRATATPSPARATPFGRSPHGSSGILAREYRVQALRRLEVGQGRAGLVGLVETGAHHNALRQALDKAEACILTMAGAKSAARKAD